MTVCIAALFHWNYGTLENPEWDVAAVTASDQMITFGDHEYEPTQTKVGNITSQIMLLVAGDYTVHSEALKRTQAQAVGTPSIKPLTAATIYGQAIQSINAKRAEDLILAPLGLNTDTFLGQQKDMADGFVNSITSQLQNYDGAEVEALIVGLEGGAAHIYKVDKYGSVSNYDDVGFAAIGIGASHARSLMMQVGYKRFSVLAPALSLTFISKKVSEAAPGVGEATDIYLVLRTGIVPVDHRLPGSREALENIYKDYRTGREQLIRGAVEKLEARLYGKKENPHSTEAAGSTLGESAEGDNNATGSSPAAGSQDTPEGSGNVQGEKS